ncbi:MAG: tetratricopeptide repeat protein [Syntrophorhabdales bacterium]|jgi:tetratricopeptide (TPR) repeat protein
MSTDKRLLIISLLLAVATFMTFWQGGNAYKALGDQKQAIMDYNKAIELNPKLAEAYYNRGNAYEVLGDQRQAAVDHEKAIALNPRLASP